MAGIIDVHTHAFPDSIAAAAMAKLCSEADVVSYLDGTVGDLLRSMDKAGVDISVVCSIATRPSQFDPILRWSEKIASERIIPLPSVHPADPDAIKKIEIIKQAGFLGVKMHPYYQNFVLDDPSLMELYEAIAEQGLVLAAHTGFDIAFERIDKAGPKRILNVVEKVKNLKFIATHMGAWEQWQQAREMLIGRDIYIETSFSSQYLGAETTAQMLLKHPPQRILFGTDSPWDDQAGAIEFLRSLGLGAELENRLFRANTAELFGLKI